MKSEACNPRPVHARGQHLRCIVCSHAWLRAVIGPTA